MAVSLKFDTSKLEQGLKALESKAKAAVEMKVSTQYVPKLREDAQLNAKWENQTGEARRRLNSGYEVLSDGYELFLAHGVDYGIWLELAHEKKYEIIMSTIEFVGTFYILPDLEGFIDKLNQK